MVIGGDTSLSTTDRCDVLLGSSVRCRMGGWRGASWSDFEIGSCGWAGMVIAVEWSMFVQESVKCALRSLLGEGMAGWIAGEEKGVKSRMRRLFLRRVVMAKVVSERQKRLTNILLVVLLARVRYPACQKGCSSGHWLTVSLGHSTGKTISLVRRFLNSSSRV